MADTETDLSESLDSFRFLVAVPGTFATLYPSTTDDMITQVLRDGFAEAQLMGLLGTYTIDEDGIAAPALTDGQIALVVIFAAIRFLRVSLLNANTSVTYKAGSAEYSTSQSAQLLRDILADLKAQKNAIIALLGSGGGAGQAFYMADQYLARVWDDYHGYHGYDAALIGW